MTARVIGWLSVALALVALAAATGAAAELMAELEPQVVDELDTARLMIRSTGSNQTQRLDLSALEEDFEVLTSQSSSQYRSINGKVESWVEYQIMLRPRRSGTLIIPPIDVGAESTPELALRVRGLDPELSQAIDRMVFFETELTADPVYVQAQTVMVRRLYYSSGAQIYSDLPGMPDIADAIVMPLGETTSRAVVRDGQRYGVVEQRFAIFPEQSGELTIPSISVTSSVRLQQPDGRTRRSGVRIATEPMTLQVLPIPPEYPAQHPWLPADDVAISDRWEPVDARVEVGDPVRRTLSARVQGNVASAIPPLEPALPDEHFRRYPEPPALKDDTDGPTLRGTREQTYAIIPTAPGTVALPPTELVWWDVNAGRVRTARAPGRTFWISGAAVTRPEAAPDAAVESAGDEPATEPPPPVEVDVRDDQVPWPGPERRRILRWTLLGLLAVAILFAWWSRFHEARRDALAPPSRRASWRHLKRTSRGGEPEPIHDALVRYLSADYGVSAPEAVRRFRAAGYGHVLDNLNAGLYRHDHPRPANGRAVLDAVRELKRRQRRREPPLPALYD